MSVPIHHGGRADTLLSHLLARRNRYRSWAEHHAPTGADGDQWQQWREWFTARWDLYGIEIAKARDAKRNNQRSKANGRKCITPGTGNGT